MSSRLPALILWTVLWGFMAAYLVLIALRRP